MDRLTYQFEDMPPDLPRPPLSAQRALGAVGIRIHPSGWAKVPAEVRRSIATEGGRDKLDVIVITRWSNSAPVKQVALTSREKDPPVDEIPVQLSQALGPLRRLTIAEWQSIGGLDRYVLDRLAHNSRLVQRALDEILPSKRPRDSSAGIVLVGHCELRTTTEVLEKLESGEILSSRAFVLSRTAGVRAARRAGELFDLYADRIAGPIELDWAIVRDHRIVLWQAHVSAWDGAFLPASSLVAATTAAVALHDMVREQDPRASIGSAGIYEAPWRVGGLDTFKDDPTKLYPGGMPLPPGSGPSSRR